MEDIKPGFPEKIYNRRPQMESSTVGGHGLAERDTIVLVVLSDWPRAPPWLM